VFTDVANAPFSRRNSRVSVACHSSLAFGFCCFVLDAVHFAFWYEHHSHDPTGAWDVPEFGCDFEHCAEVMARISDRLPSRKPVVVVSMVSAALGYLVLAFVRDYLLLLVLASAFLGLGASAFPQVFALARTQYSGNSISQQAVAGLRSIFSLAWVVGPLGGSVLLENFGFTGLFLASSACYVIALAFVLFLPVKATIDTHASINSSLDGKNAPLLTVGLVVACFAFYNMAMSMGASWLPILVTKTLAGTTTSVGFIAGLGALLEIPIMLGFALWRKRPNDSDLIVGAFALCTLYFVMVGSASSILLLNVAQVAKATALAISTTVGMAFFGSLLPKRVGTAMTLYSNAMSIGSMLAGVVGGFVVQHFGLRNVFFLSVSLATLAGFVFFWQSRRFIPSQQGQSNRV
jgi:MFS transporter, SET family, sugar efflux transporter